MTFRSAVWIVVKIIVGVVLTVLLLGVGYFVVYPRVDYAICWAKVGARLGADGTWEAVAEKLDEALVPGLTPDQVHSIVEKAGPIEMPGGNLPVGFESIYLDVCSWESNNMWIGAWYSEDGTLSSVRFTSASF